MAWPAGGLWPCRSPPRPPVAAVEAAPATRLRCASGGVGAPCTEPPEVGRAPGGSAYRSDVLPQEKRFAPKLRGLESADSLFTRPTQVTKRFILSLGHVARGEVSRTPESCPFAGIPAFGVHPLSWFFGDQRRRDAPADLAFFRQRAGEPLPPRAGCRAKDEVLTFGLELTDECSDGKLAGTKIPNRDALSVVFFGDRSNGNGLFMDIQSDGKRARLVQG
jgi:hypothetical protein